MSHRTYQNLDADLIVATVEQLTKRIEARFPEAGLRRVGNELLVITQRARERSRSISRPIYWLRCATLTFVAAVPLSILLLFVKMPVEVEAADFHDFHGLLEALDASTNIVLVLGVAILFLITLERRFKRRRALDAIHELRSIAHIIDMYQLTKDPERVIASIVVTEVSPKLQMNRAELGRYLDYCSELLALTGKVAALYVENFDDPIVLSSVNEIESLTTGLSRKIWQKMMILHRFDAGTTIQM